MQNEIDILVYDLVMTDDAAAKRKIASKIWEKSQEKDIYLSSIHNLYRARGKGEFSGFTVPAINIRTLTYDTARAAFRALLKIKSAALIFEIAKSEIGYTEQSPVEYTALCLAAAIKENYQGPVFIQGDHFQINAKNFFQDKFKELNGLKEIIFEAVDAGFLNIDIDSSTLVDLENPNLHEQQRNNFEACVELTKYIRQIQPKNITISVGGEIGEVGSKNSTPEDLEAFMQGYLQKLNKNMLGISKISIQTGTAHGGVVLSDGSIAKVKLDFDTLKKLSKLAREKFGLAGAVQHGASTLPDEAFHKFSENETAEVHLATQFQNMVFESTYFAKDLREKIYAWLNKTMSAEKKDGETEEQFIYKTRKKALGPFKKDILNIKPESREAIGKELEQKFDFLFKELNIANTKELINKYIKPQVVEFCAQKAAFAKKEAKDLEGAD